MPTSSIKKSATKKSAPKKTSTRKSAPKKSGVNKKTVKKSHKSKSTDNNALTLSPVLAINDNKKLYIELGKILDNKKKITIDASAVTMIDTAILQLLLAFIQKAKSKSIAVDWMKPSEEFISRVDMLNLTGKLGLQESR